MIHTRRAMRWRWRRYSGLCLVGAILVIAWFLFPAAKCSLGFDTEYRPEDHISDDEYDEWMYSRPRGQQITPDGYTVPEEVDPWADFHEYDEPEVPDRVVDRIAHCFKRHSPIHEPPPWKIGLLAGLIVFWRVFDYLGYRAYSRQIERR